MPSSILLKVFCDMFLQEAAGSLAFGAVLDNLGFWDLRSVDDYKVEVLITLALLMGGHFLARKLHCSGPLAMVVAGTPCLSLGRI